MWLHNAALGARLVLQVDLYSGHCARMECIFVGISPLALFSIRAGAWMTNICKRQSLQIHLYDVFVFLYDAKQKSARHSIRSLGPCRLITHFLQPPLWQLVQIALQNDPPAEWGLFSSGLPREGLWLAHHCTRPVSLNLLL